MGDQHAPEHQQKASTDNMPNKGTDSVHGSKNHHAPAEQTKRAAHRQPSQAKAQQGRSTKPYPRPRTYARHNTTTGKHYTSKQPHRTTRRARTQGAQQNPAPRPGMHARHACMAAIPPCTCHANVMGSSQAAGPYAMQCTSVHYTPQPTKGSPKSTAVAVLQWPQAAQS